MLKITDAEIKRKIEFQNPWWDAGSIYDDLKAMTPRAYLGLFYKLLSGSEVKRAVVLMGPRRVGKTVMLYHSIQRLIDSGMPPKNIIYFSIDSPNFTGLGLERLLGIALGGRLKRDTSGLHVFFDEIQYLKNWEVHLKTLVDEFPGIKFVASGSAAAALRMKSRESGAGRFTEFILPPLTFCEFLSLSKKEHLIPSNRRPGDTFDVGPLNVEFVNYINFGGYPEALFSAEIQKDPSRFIGSDIIDKVLLRDLPSLYGISDTRELNRLFTMLAYNTANEISLDELSKGSGVAKPTISRYLTFLEAAFLVKRLPRIDDKAKRFQRERTFKIHLTNPSMRSALFGLVNENSEEMGSLTETAVYSQTLHDPIDNEWYYARWKDGEVDLVSFREKKPYWGIEVKWSDSHLINQNKMRSLIRFLGKNPLEIVTVTSRTKWGRLMLEGKPVAVFPASYLCFAWGLASVERRYWTFLLDISEGR